MTFKIAVSLILLAGPAAAADWPMGRRNASRTGWSPDVVRPPLTLRWTSAAIPGRFVSSPVISKGILYIGGEDNKLYAFDAYTGQVKWTFTTGDFIDATPAVSRGVVFVGSYDGNFYALDAVTGALKWQTLTGGRELSSPAVYGRVVYAGSGFPNKFTQALSAWDGSVLWRQSAGQFVYASPATNGSLLANGANDGKFYFLQASNGQSQFGAVSTNAPLYFNALALDGSRVYGASGGFQNTLYAFNAANGQTAWSAVLPLSCGGGSLMSSPVLSPSGVYISGTCSGEPSGTDVHAYDAVTGGSLGGYTAYQTNSASLGKDLGFASSPAGAHDMLYLTDADGRMHFIDQITGGPLAAPVVVGAGDPLMASAATADGWVYAASYDGKVYAYQGAEILALSSPTDTDAVIGASSVTVKAVFQAPGGQTFQTYDLEYGAGVAPAQWVPLVTGSTAAADGTIEPLVNWDFSALDDGDYKMRLTAHFSGSSRSAEYGIKLLQKYADAAVTASQALTLAAPDGTMLVIPAGALSQNDSLSLSVPATYSNQGIPAGVTPTTVVREILLGKPDTRLLKPVTLHIPYTDAEVAGLTPAQLRMYTWDETAGKWQVVSTCRVNTATKRVSADLYHFSLYRVMAYAPGPGPLIDKSVAYSTPNPARGDTLYFKVGLNDDADVSVRVYTVAGEKVADLKSAGLGGTVVHMPWGIGGIASGVYVYRVEAKSAGRKDHFTKKLAIIH